MRTACLILLLAGLTALAACSAEPGPGTPKPATGMAELLAASPAADWAPLPPEDTVYLDLPAGRVVLLLAPDFAPAHVDNLRSLLHAHFFDGLAVTRVQDNYVTQWGDADSTHDRGEGFRKALPDEYYRPVAGLPSFTPAPDGDVYAPQAGFVAGFPVGRDPDRGQAWPLHCYGIVGVGRNLAPDNGGGEELYAVIGHAPRHLDRNLAVVGRVVQGMPLLSSLPRGSGGLGFYDKERNEQPVPIVRARLAADLPPDQRLPLERLRTDSATFRRLIEARRTRREDFFVDPTRHIDVCNVPLPVRTQATAPPPAR